jgi:hypothetical protein
MFLVCHLFTAPTAGPSIHESNIVFFPRAISFEFDAPDESYWNGPLQGYTLSYKYQHDDSWIYKTITDVTSRVRVKYITFITIRKFS